MPRPYYHSELPNFIDLTGSDDEDDNECEVLGQRPVAQPAVLSNSAPVLPVAAQGTLLEAAQESARCLSSWVPAVSTHNRSRVLNSSRSTPYTSTLVARSPSRVENAYVSPYGSQTPPRSDFRPFGEPSRPATQPRTSAPLNTQATLEGFFHRPEPFSAQAKERSEAKRGQLGGKESMDNIQGICERIASKKNNISKELSEGQESIVQINKSSLSRDEKINLLGQIRDSKGDEMSVAVNGSSSVQSDPGGKVARDFLRMQLFPHLKGMLDAFKEIRTLEDRKRIAREATRKMFSKPYFKETLLKSNAPSSKARENEAKAFVKSCFDEVIAGKGMGGAMAIGRGSQPEGQTEYIEILDDLSDIDLQDSGHQSVDRTGYFFGAGSSSVPPRKRTSDGEIKVISASSVARAGSASQSSALAAARGIMLVGRSSGLSRVAPVVRAEPQSSTLAQPLTRIVTLSVGRVALAAFVDNRELSNRPKLPTQHCKSRSLVSQHKSSNSSNLASTSASAKGNASTKGKLGRSDLSRASRALGGLSTSLQHLDSLVNSAASPQAQKSALQQTNFASSRPTACPSPAHAQRSRSSREGSKVGSSRLSRRLAEADPVTSTPLAKQSHIDSYSSDDIAPILRLQTSQRNSSNHATLGNDSQPAPPPYPRGPPPPAVPRPSPKEHRRHLAEAREEKARLMKLVMSTKPYIRHCDRDLIEEGVLDQWWGKGKTLHVDFSWREIMDVWEVLDPRSRLNTARATSDIPSDTQTHDSAYIKVEEGSSDTLSKVEDMRLHEALFRPKQEFVQNYARTLKGDGFASTAKQVVESGLLTKRNNRDIVNFLKDASEGLLSETLTYMEVDAKSPAAETQVRAPPRDRMISFSINNLLRHRESGRGHTRGGLSSTIGIHTEFRLRAYDTMKPWRMWGGGSGDGACAAWHPDGDYFAVGFSALTDNYNMQYNRPNNLVFGDLWRNTMKEFPNHRTRRPLTSNTDIVDDFFLYHTVSHVKFGPRSNRMYSASFDQTVKIWDFAAPNPTDRQLVTLAQGASVDVMALSADEHLATGTSDGKMPVKIWDINQDRLSSSRISSHFGSARGGVHPSCMQWGQSSAVKDRLLVGFSGSGEDGPSFQKGDIAVWDAISEKKINVYPNAQNVFDAVWHPTLPKFIAGCTPGKSDSGKPLEGQRTAVRLYHSLSGGCYRDDIEVACPAYDINDVTWCTEDANYVTASCTDGKVYVWDIRLLPRLLHVLEHGDACIQLPQDEDRERTDTGVRFTQWGASSDRLFTGSSDGIVKSWNIKRAPEDAHIEDIVNVGAVVMSGTFSPDYSRLLIADGKGSIRVLATGLDEEDQVQEMQFEPIVKPELETDRAAYREAQRLVSSGQIIIHGRRAYQGEFYQDFSQRMVTMAEDLERRYNVFEHDDAIDGMTPVECAEQTTSMLAEEVNIPTNHGFGAAVVHETAARPTDEGSFTMELENTTQSVHGTGSMEIGSVTSSGNLTKNKLVLKDFAGVESALANTVNPEARSVTITNTGSVTDGNANTEPAPELGTFVDRWPMSDSLVRAGKRPSEQNLREQSPFSLIKRRRI